MVKALKLERQSIRMLLFSLGPGNSDDHGVRRPYRPRQQEEQLRII
jgi:hypothetical protein